MTGYEGYIWFLPSWYPLHWQDVDYYNSEPNLQEVANSPHFVRESVPCTTNEVERATQGHFVLAQTTFASSETKVVGGITVREFLKMYSQDCWNAVSSIDIFLFHFPHMFMVIKLSPVLQFLIKVDVTL